jgi:hypothetical protein
MIQSLLSGVPDPDPDGLTYIEAKKLINWGCIIYNSLSVHTNKMKRNKKKFINTFEFKRENVQASTPWRNKHNGTADNKQ